MNLLTSPWLAARRASGARAFIAAHQIAEPDDPVVALDFPRPDWNAAVTELLIGLATLAFRPRDDGAWRTLWRRKPDPTRFAEALSPFAYAFDLFGDGPRAFQDFDPLAEAEDKGVAQLLIDAPGGNALKLNTDLFNKRGRVGALCPAYVAAALITLQTYAPAGGAGFRTSMRGGGPLTTLVRPKPDATLWDLVLANMPLTGALPYAQPSDAAVWSNVFPWLAPCRTSEKGRPPFGPGDGHFLQAFFATPRRIRLGGLEPGHCALDGPADQGVVGAFRTTNYGYNYEGWRHPLSPYRRDPKADIHLPLHPRAGGSTYRDWLGLSFSDTQAQAFVADPVRLWQEDRAERLDGDRYAIDAFGFAMDNMKPLSWTQARVPLFAFASRQDREAFFTTARTLVAGAQEAARALQFAAMRALFGAWSEKDKRYTVPDTAKSATVDDLGDAFWRETEAAFERALKTCAAAPQENRDALVIAWLGDLRNAALALFEDRIGGDEAFIEDAKRLVFAKNGLALAFAPRGQVGKALGVPAPDKKEKAA